MRKLDKGAMFPKDNIAGDMKTMRDKIITSIPLLSFSIAKKPTKSRPRLKFVMLMWLKKNACSLPSAGDCSNIILEVPRSNHKEQDKFKDNIIKQQFG